MFRIKDTVHILLKKRRAVNNNTLLDLSLIHIYADALSVIHEQNEIKEIFTNI